MISDIEIWRSANLLIKQHGEDAILVASQRADALLAEGDVEGLSVWKKILRAIGELRRSTPRTDEGVN
jgi:hypothetical protein